ncbi:exopolysaccharide production repressor exox [Pseudorhizobium endolithicum]|uniref:Exopolysaccharide production repressor exox n=1 Tax=Pseudorhizobium endolithicum TaxID=1191678 RepID=A0ABN7JMI2_9HYPH|nr:exopolysaccharide production repressor protein [Pseudorhizobium endolithicum]CAD7038440.1 exopolysaccharide production repressor exox [Pseudorhizobium endolithicum]
MYAPKVFVSMMCVLLVFAAASYLMTGSLVIALVQTLACAIILQIGYFIGVLYLVRREKASRESASDPAQHLRGRATRNADVPADAAATNLKITDG